MSSVDTVVRWMLDEQKNKEFVWYSPEWNEIKVSKKSDGFLFKNEHGQFHSCYRVNRSLDSNYEFKTASFYLIGEL